jgi:energy-coupling factor transporter ATP-binding protein EcfA2
MYLVWTGAFLVALKLLQVGPFAELSWWWVFAPLGLMITLKNIVLRRGTKVLLDNVSVTLNPGEKVGLVGRNGAGKSTLFALLNGTLHEDGGDFSIPKQWRMAQVAQNMPETDETATDLRGGGRHPTGGTARAAPAARKQRRPATTTRSTAWPLRRSTPTWLTPATTMQSRAPRR